MGSGDDSTIKELAETVARVIGYRGTIVFDPSKPDGAPRKLMDSARINSLGWRATIGLSAGLETTYADFLAGHAVQP